MSDKYKGISGIYDVKDFFDDTFVILKQLGSRINGVNVEGKLCITSILDTPEEKPASPLYLDGSKCASFRQMYKPKYERPFTTLHKKNVENHIEYFLEDIVFLPPHKEPIKKYIDKLSDKFQELTQSESLPEANKATTNNMNYKIKEIQKLTHDEPFFAAHMEDILAAALQIGMVYFVCNGISNTCNKFDGDETNDSLITKYQKFSISHLPCEITASTTSVINIALQKAAISHLKKIITFDIEPELLVHASILQSNDLSGRNKGTLLELLKIATDNFQNHTNIHLLAPAGTGKTTQLIQTGIALMESNVLNTRTGKRCIYIYVHAGSITKTGNLLESILQKSPFNMTKEETSIITNAMNGTECTAHQDLFFLAIDGLDEIQEKKKDWIYEEIRSLTNMKNLITIIASRSTELAFSGNSSITIQLERLDFESTQVQNYLSKYGINSINLQEIYRTPMLLILLVHREQIFKNYSTENLAELTLIPEDKTCGISTGEVIWNYLQAERLPAASRGEEELYETIIFDTLPALMYKYFLLRDKTEVSERSFLNYLKESPELRNTSEVQRKRIIKLLAKINLLQYQEGNIKIHQLYRDYFSMVYAAKVIGELSDINDDLSEAQESILSNPLVFDNVGNNELMIGILPAVLLSHGISTSDYKQKTISYLNHSLEDPYTQTDSKVYAYQRFYRAMYSLWCVRHFAETNPSAEIFLHEMAQDTFHQLEIIGEQLHKDPSRIHPVCAMHVFCYLSKVYRSGLLLLQYKYKPKIDSLYKDEYPQPHFELSKKYGFDAAKIQYETKKKSVHSFDVRFTDGYNYLAKAYLAAYDELCYWASIHSGENYILKNGDLILDKDDIKPVMSLKQPTIHSERQLVSVGSILDYDAVKERITILKYLARYWLERAEKENSVLSMNLLSLIEEDIQDRKERKDRNYLRSYELCQKAASISHPTGTTYAKLKCIQFLLERKITLENGIAQKCISESKSINEETQNIINDLLENTNYSIKDYGKYLFYKTLLQLQKDNSKDNLRLICDQLKTVLTYYRSIPVFIAVFQIVLELGDKQFVPLFNEASKNFIIEDTSNDQYRYSFQAYAESVISKHLSDQSSPSLQVFNETCDEIAKLKNKYTVTIQKLIPPKAIGQMQKCVEKQKGYLNSEEIKKQIQQYDYIRYSQNINFSQVLKTSTHT